MSTALCPECGGALAEGLTQGLCTKCLMVQGLKLATGLPAPNIAQPSQDLPRDFGEYELLEEIARGGMGIIYRARQRSLDRHVAVKRLLFGPDATPDSVKRFRGEAAVAASLQHPNIVTIHEVGVREGEHYLVMDLVDGPNLAKFVKDQPLPPRRAAGYLKTIAEAVHYAHERGVLHRDLKPSNVLIDSNDQPRVTDFGLAKRLNGDSSLTLSGHMLGSPSYMPPEQAGATHHKVGRRSDVYSLGAMLYHTLVGRPPFVGENLTQTLNHVFNREPVSPRLLNPAVPRDLETICLKCIEKEPPRRFPTALALAEELGRFLRDEPIHSRPVSSPEKLWRWCRRKPALALLVLLLHLVGLVGLGGILWQWRRAEQNLYVANIHLANEAMNGHDLVRTRELLGAIEHSAVQRNMRGWEWRYLAGRARNQEARILGRQDSWIADLAVSPDQQQLATISEDGVAKLWNLANKKEITWAAHANQGAPQPDWLHHAVVFTPDGSKLITAGEDGAVRCWKLGGVPHLLFEITNLQEPVNRLAISHDGTMLAGQGRAYLVYLWRLTDSAARLSSEFKTDSVVPAGIAFAPDNRMLLVGWTDQPILRYDLSTPDHPAPQPLLATAPPFAFSPDGKWLATCGFSRHVVRRWSWPDLAPLPELVVQGGSLDGLTFSADSRLLAAGLGGGQINIWDVTNRQPQYADVLLGHESPVPGLCFVQNGNQVKLISSSPDKTVRLWDISVREYGDNVLRLGTPVLAVGISPDSSYLATVVRTPNAAGKNKQIGSFTLQLRDLKTCCQISSVTFGGAGLNPRIIFAPNSHEVAVTDFGTLEFHKLPSLELEVSRGERGLVYATNGSWLAYIRNSEIIKCSSINASESVLVPRVPGLQQLALSPDGRILASSEQFGANIWLWDARDGRSLGPPLSGHTLRIVGLSFTSDGKTLVSAGWDGRMGIWNMNNRANIAFLRGHNNDFNQMVISPDGGTIATGGDDSTVRLWNVARHQEIAVLEGHTDLVNDLAFSADDRWLASASNDGTVRLWHAPSLQEIEVAEKQRERNGP